MSKERVLAKRYTKALFELAHEAGLEDRIGSDLGRIVSANNLCPELLKVLSVGSISLRAKQELIEKLAKYLDLNPLTVHFFHLLIEARRANVFETVNEEYEKRRAEWRSIVYADVTVADDMDVVAEARLKDVLSIKIGKDVVLRIKKDKGLIGGMVVRIADQVYDGSIATEMRQLECGLREICM